MDILRIATSGSVDDGKSTLIGRLLFETGKIPKDRMEQLEINSRKRGLNFTDLSLLTDGLISEREQGITIDVAHIYFQTSRRKYIIADTPGHVEYTRNMVTGASLSDVAIVLVDARKGILEQTRRHLSIAHLIEMKHVVIAINKMDLVNYEEKVFADLQKKLADLTKELGLKARVSFIPISALEGEGVTKFHGKMPWYKGASILEVLEAVPSESESSKASSSIFRIQTVIRPKDGEHRDYRGYAGYVAQGTFSVGQEIQLAGSDKRARITSITKWGKELESTSKDLAVTLELDTDMDLSRGDLILDAQNSISLNKESSATVCWMDNAPLRSGSRLGLQQGTFRTRIKVDRLLPATTLPESSARTENELALNDIGKVVFRSSTPLPQLPYSKELKEGAFILIDESTKNTVGVGFLQA